MVTIYDLLEVDEKASKEEIEKSYQRLILEYHKDPKLTEEENADNEIILNKIKIAYEILMDDNKRAKYDSDLGKKRAEELIKNVSTNKENLNNKSTNINQNNINSIESNSIKNSDKEYKENIQQNSIQDEDIRLSEDEQRKIKRAAEDEFRTNLKKAQKVEEEYNKAYNQAYNSYMRKLGYNVKEPLTLKRVINVVIFILVTIVVCIIAWLIPPIRNLLTDLYNENIIIKALVDIIKIIFNSIINIFK